MVLNWLQLATWSYDRTPYPLITGSVYPPPHTHTLWLPLTPRPQPHQPPGLDPSPVKQTGHLKVPPMPSKLCSIRWHRSLAGESNIWLHSLHSWLMPSSATQEHDTTGYTHHQGQAERMRDRETQTHAAKRQGTTFLHINRLRGRLVSIWAVEVFELTGSFFCFFPSLHIICGPRLIIFSSGQYDHPSHPSSPSSAQCRHFPSR